MILPNLLSKQFQTETSTSWHLSDAVTCQISKRKLLMKKSVGPSLTTLIRCNQNLISKKSSWFSNCFFLLFSALIGQRIDSVFALIMLLAIVHVPGDGMFP